MTKTRLALLAAIALLIVLYFALDLGRFLTLDYFRAQQHAIERYVAGHPVQASAIYFLTYVAVTGLSLPGAALMTLAGGAVFGLAWATLIVSFAASIGATLAFLASRFVLRDWVQRKFGDKLRPVNAGIARDGAFYLFALRLVPAFPFFVINLVMGLTPLRASTFYWVSQLGMLPGTLLFVYAGTQLGEFRISFGLLAALALLGIFPLLAKKTLEWIKSRKVLARWPRPRSFDCNLVVIGAGSAGLVAAYIAAAVKARVTLIEKNEMGGDCLNTGCVPSKALIRSSRLIATLRRAQAYGLKQASAEFDFADVMARVQRVIRTVAPHDSVERYSALGVECIRGEARITSPYTVEVDAPAGKRTLTTRAIVIAAGARPYVPPIPGIDQVGYLTSDTVWSLRTLPRRLLVLGGGPIGCELTQCFARLGASVTQVEMLPRLLIREDPEISERVARQFEREGIR
ncbi:MAG TPA: FAD-dependent oxidoreductase, partial [Burkholderiales bacterium]|nr:FAD-dependent oxidoreductase [Burkholderiales bacterium]